MAQPVSVMLPDELYVQVERTAHATQQTVESVVVSALQVPLLWLPGPIPELVHELTALAALDDDALRAVLLETLPVEKYQALSHLLGFYRIWELDASERTQLDALQAEADRLLLRRAQARMLLRIRGLRVPAIDLYQAFPNTD